MGCAGCRPVDPCEASAWPTSPMPRHPGPLPARPAGPRDAPDARPARLRVGAQGAGDECLQGEDALAGEGGAAQPRQLRHRVPGRVRRVAVVVQALRNVHGPARLDQAAVKVEPQVLRPIGRACGGGRRGVEHPLKFAAVLLRWLRQVAQAPVAKLLLDEVGHREGIMLCRVGVGSKGRSRRVCAFVRLCATAHACVELGI